MLEQRPDHNLHSFRGSWHLTYHYILFDHTVLRGLLRCTSRSGIVRRHRTVVTVGGEEPAADDAGNRAIVQRDFRNTFLD